MSFGGFGISGNSATNGGGIRNTGTANVVNTIIDNNTGGDCSGAVTSLGHNLDSDNTCGLAGAGDISNTNPFLGPLQDNGGHTFTHALLAGSPAIDSGDDTAAPATDQRGVARPLGAASDIGAYEAEPLQSGTITVTKTGDAADGFCGTLDCSLREAIASGDSGDAITIPAGTYTLTAGTELTIDKNLTLTGAGSGDTIIQAATAAGLATHRVLLTTADSTVTISSVTIRFGTTGDNGGGIYKHDGSLTLADTNVAENTATGSGGGVYSDKGFLLITGSKFSNNTTFGNFKNGGGVFVGDGTGDLTNSTFSNNVAHQGGAISFCCTGDADPHQHHGNQ